jgi:Protein of unknown function (DUF5132)
MALWDSITEGLGGSLMSNGAAAVVLAPVVVPAVLTGMRPVVKTVIKGGVLVFDKTREMVAEVGEQMSDIVAEARAELTTSATTVTDTPHGA